MVNKKQSQFAKQNVGNRCSSGFVKEGQTKTFVLENLKNNSCLKQQQMFQIL